MPVSAGPEGELSSALVSTPSLAQLQLLLLLLLLCGCWSMQAWSAETPM